nr:hypothetical protein [uncultured Ottowia sp.]
MGLDLLLFLIWLHGISQAGTLKFVPEHGRSIPSFGFRRPSQLLWKADLAAKGFGTEGKMQAAHAGGEAARAAPSRGKALFCSFIHSVMS